MKITFASMACIAGVLTLDGARFALSPPSIVSSSRVAAGSGFSGSATIEDGVVTSVTVLSGGSNYTQGAEVSISGDGSGALLNATIENGVVVSVAVANGGSEYSTASVVASSKAGVQLNWNSNEDPRYYNEWDVYCKIKPAGGSFGSELLATIVSVPTMTGPCDTEQNGGCFLEKPSCQEVDEFETGKTYRFYLRNYGPNFPMFSGDSEASNYIDIVW